MSALQYDERGEETITLGGEAVIFSGYRDEEVTWFRMFGFGLLIKDKRKAKYLTFSERNKIECIHTKHHIFRFLKPHGNCPPFPGQNRRKFKMVVSIPEQEKIPKWYGIAYVTVEKCEVIAMPIPINLIVSFARSVYFFIKCPYILIKYQHELENYILRIKSIL